MLDNCGRTIDYLRLSVTDLCNYPVPVLHAAGGRGEAAPWGHPLHRGALGDRRRGGSVRGEEDPPHRRGASGAPGLIELVRQLRAIPGVEELCLTTNGSLLPRLARPLREAGLDRLNISLDTLRPDRFAAMTRLGTLRDVLDGIQAAEAAGFEDLKLDTVLIGGFNDDEIGDLVDLSRDPPLELRFIELMPMGPCAGWDRSCFLPCDTVLDRVPELEAIEAQGVARRYRLPGARGTVGLISPVSHDFCADCRRIRVTADGKLKGCLHSRRRSPSGGSMGRR